MISIKSGVTDRELGDAWRKASVKQRRAVLWDYAPEKRGRAFFEECRLADAAYRIYEGRELLAVLWLNGLGSGKRTAALHFFFAGDVKRINLLAISRKALGVLFARWRCLLCLVPCKWYGTRRLLLSLGFGLEARIPWGAVVNGCEMDTLIYMKVKDAG